MPEVTGTYDLERFVEAQEGTYETALAELRVGHKETHWIWFVFPQLAELGRSSTALRYGISGIGEAEAYLAHPVLGPRLVEATEAALSSGETDVYALMGSAIDAVKLRSSLTLFSCVDGAPPVFAEAIDALFDGEVDKRTTWLLETEADRRRQREEKRSRA